MLLGILILLLLLLIVVMQDPILRRMSLENGLDRYWCKVVGVSWMYSEQNFLIEEKPIHVGQLVLVLRNLIMGQGLTIYLLQGHVYMKSTIKAMTL